MLEPLSLPLSATSPPPSLPDPPPVSVPGSFYRVGFPHPPPGVSRCHHLFPPDRTSQKGSLPEGRRRWGLTPEPEPPLPLTFPSLDEPPPRGPAAWDPCPPSLYRCLPPPPREDLWTSRRRLSQKTQKPDPPRPVFPRVGEPGGLPATGRRRGKTPPPRAIGGGVRGPGRRGDGAASASTSVPALRRFGSPRPPPASVGATVLSPGKPRGFSVSSYCAPLSRRDSLGLRLQPVATPSRRRGNRCARPRG